MKFIKTATQVIFVLAISVLLLSSAVRYTVNNPDLYHKGFQKYDIPKATGLSLQELDRVTRELIRYFNARDEKVHILLENGREFYNEKEVAHLRDVKELLRFDYRLQEGALAYGLGYAAVVLWRSKARVRHLSRLVLWGSASTLALMLALSQAILIGFDRVFLAFHLVSFSNLLWLLDPATDNLIRMFPQGFFFDASLRVAGVTLAGAAALGGAAVGGLWLIRKRKPSLGQAAH